MTSCICAIVEWCTFLKVLLHEETGLFLWLLNPKATRAFWNTLLRRTMETLLEERGNLPVLCNTHHPHCDDAKLARNQKKNLFCTIDSPKCILLSWSGVNWSIGSSHDEKCKQTTEENALNASFLISLETRIKLYEGGEEESSVTSRERAAILILTTALHKHRFLLLIWDEGPWL